LLGQDRADGAAQVPLLVEDGHDHGNGGVPHVGIGVHRRLTLPRTGDTVARAGVLCAGPQIVSAYGADESAHGRRPEVLPVPTSQRSPRPRSTHRHPPRQSRPGPRPPEPPRRKPRWVMRTVTTLSVVVLASAGIGHAVLSGLEEDIARVDPFRDMKNRPEAGHGMNILLVGTDGRERIGKEEREKYRLGGAPCHCTDTMMIVHISEDRDRASVVSLPRDSYAVTPPHTDRVSGERH